MLRRWTQSCTRSRTSSEENDSKKKEMETTTMKKKKARGEETPVGRGLLARSRRSLLLPLPLLALLPSSSSTMSRPSCASRTGSRRPRPCARPWRGAAAMATTQQWWRCRRRRSASQPVSSKKPFPSTPPLLLLLLPLFPRRSSRPASPSRSSSSRELPCGVPEAHRLAVALDEGGLEAALRAVVLGGEGERECESEKKGDDERKPLFFLPIPGIAVLASPPAP